MLIAVSGALVIGITIGGSRLLERMFYPIIVFFQAIPKVALAPLWLIVFGFGIGPKVARAAMVAFFPLLVGEFVGARAGLGYLIQFRSARLDLPGIFSPLVVLAVIGLLLDLGSKLIGRRLIKWQGE